MPEPLDDAQRISRLEERLAWLERHVVEQDKVMLQLAEDFERVRRELLALRARAAGAGRVAEAEAPADERPPHY